NGDGQFVTGSKFLTDGSARVDDTHSHALRGIQGKRAREQKAGLFQFLLGRGKPIHLKAGGGRRIFWLDEAARHWIGLLDRHGARRHAAGAASTATSTGGPRLGGGNEEQGNHEKRNRPRVCRFHGRDYRCAPEEATRRGLSKSCRGGTVVAMR